MTTMAQRRRFMISSFAIIIIAMATLAEEVPLDCQQGWTLMNTKCYRLFNDRLPWESADRVCQSYGSQLVRVKDFYENLRVSRFVQRSGASEFWTGANRQSVSPVDQRTIIWSDGDRATVALGDWQNYQPNLEDGQCVHSRLVDGLALWRFVPCETKAPYICQRPPAPQGSFHCHNGNFIRQGLKCDGEDDCGDGSDELDCSSQCAVYFRNQMSGTINSPNHPNNYPNSKTCSWLIELPLGYNVRLQFTEFNIEPRFDEVTILAGGLTVSKSLLVERLSGRKTSGPLPTYTSYNNMLMMVFSTDFSVNSGGFSAQFTAVRDESFPVLMTLTALDTAQQLTSPFYPAYLGSQDYTWVITAAERVKIITLQIIEVDMKDDDRIVIRDGNVASSPLLAKLTSDPESVPRYVLSTGRQLYITMQTRSMATGKGFIFQYWQGCKVTLNGISGEIHSPGYGNGNYVAYQTCTYDVTVPGGLSVTARFDAKDVHSSDNVTVYEGNNLITAFPAVINSGAFRVVFDSDAILTDKGFSLTFSVGCENPQFGPETMVSPPTQVYTYGTSVTIGCASGYAFSAEEFRNTRVPDFVPLSRVTLTCEAGGVWNLDTLPICEPRYCGQAPAVSNAYVVNSTGVTYGGTVTYLCYPGFAMQGQDTIQCTEAGNWTDTPSCQTSSCSALPMITNGNKSVLFVDGSSFSSIVEYTCNSGYEVAGEPILFCRSDGTWSASVPSCNVKQCYVPTIPNGMIERSGQMINVGDTVTASCVAGYVSNIGSGGNDNVTLSCQADRSLRDLTAFMCSYEDKCRADPSYCNQLCRDSEFESRTCSCYDGYMLDADMKTCINIDECQTDNGGCDHECTDGPGTYTCSCRGGYVLFSNDGIQGYNLAPNEDGMRPGDVRRFNHTCLPVSCPSPPTVANSVILVPLGTYYYGDVVAYACDLGYELNGPSHLTCTQQGQWDKAAPQCDPAMCLAESLFGARNPATVIPNSNVRLGEIVTLACNVPGKPAFNKTRHCIYYQGQYQLAGSDYDCGYIECGQPEQVSGSLYSPSAIIDTVYGSSFQFGCQNLYALRGTSEQNDTTVRCLATGQWDFGSLRCEGVTCGDPGQPPDGQQVNPTSYDEGDLVHFSCNREGFSLTDFSPLLCKLNASGTGLEWNNTVPQCVDTQDPVLSNCPSQPVTVARYTPAGQVIGLPSFSDNDVLRRLRYTHSTGVAMWPTMQYLLFKLEVITVIATDYAGNTYPGNCRHIVRIQDDVPPIIECPEKIVREFTVENETINVQFSSGDLRKLEGNDGNPPMFTPSEVNFRAELGQLSSFPPYRTFGVTVSVLDDAGNSASCEFDLLVRPNDCSPFTLRDPLHGQKSCTSSASGFQCVLSCDAGYIFYDQPTSPSITYMCNSGNPWPGPDVPACVKADDPSQEARFQQTFRFTYIKTENQTCANLDIYRAAVGATDVIRRPTEILPNICYMENAANRITGTINVSDVAEIGLDTVLINITLIYDVRNISIYEQCKGLVQVNFEGDSFVLTENFRRTFTPIGCPAISTNKGGTLVEEQFFCVSGKQAKYTPAGSTSQIDVCVACPEGTRTVGQVCELCTEGSFNPVPASTVCTTCPTGAFTFQKGATSNGECTALCRSGTYSSTGLPPCMPCPKDSYSVNSTYCMPCPVGHVTRKSGSTSNTQCLPPCPIGTYSPIDGHDFNCKSCPIGFYADTTATKLCTECSGNQKTAREGSTSVDDCIVHTGCNTTNNPCINGGICNILNHVVMCSCPDSYYGQLCQIGLNRCFPNPCYYNGQCRPLGTSFTCNCPPGTSGNRCENLIPSCTADYCLNGGACRNQLNGKTCLCKGGFSGTRCEVTEAVCKQDSCKNNGRCVPMDNVRFRCECAPGFDGNQCDNNIDDCASTPCLHGGNCTDLLNDYQCSCPNGFFGKQCQIRQRFCTSNSCNQGTCVEDLKTNSYRCVCGEGSYFGNVCQYEAYFGRDINGSAALTFNSSGVTIQQCLNQCETESCKEVLFDSYTSTCLIGNANQQLFLQSGNLIYYRRVCGKVEASYWTPWYDSSTPSDLPSSSDDELLTRLNDHGLNICGGKDAVEAQCRVVGTMQPPSEILLIPCTASRGLLCSNSAQADSKCEDYEIRFKCLSARVLSQSPCEDINYCSPSVCLNRGACSEKSTEASCSCSSGYTGSVCQHLTDTCASKPCLNNGTCSNQLNGFSCSCMPGFGGQRCEKNIDECAIYLCNTTGTHTCTDHVNRAECVCKPGYTGDRCELNINECLSQPCLHGGQCADRVNGFLCTCNSGWTGLTCETKVELCTSNTCSNGAACRNLFNDFYCDCFPNTYGKTCSNAPRICVNANPCLHGSPCNESQGFAQCTCAPEYRGDGCQIRRDICSETNPGCQNGATCSVSPQGVFTCHCAEGYTGQYCEENIDDCLGNACPVNSTCIDMVHRHFCRCNSVGMSGENCQKETERKFDLLFSNPRKSSMAALEYPLHLSGGGFSITMWIKYLNKRGMGTFFTMYKVSDPRSLSGKEELVRLDETGVRLSMSQQPLMLNTTVDYNEDGEWHYIVLTWNQTTGLFSFFVDTIRIPLENYNTGQPLNLNVWMVLGCHYVTDGSCFEGQGFNGYISQVTLYNRELIFEDELTRLGNRNPFIVFPDAVMTWGEFFLNPGVTRIYPSEADLSCPTGFTGPPACTTPIPGKTRVSIDQDSCPTDIIKHSTNRITDVTWSDVRFTGQVNQIKSTVDSGSVFLWGKYPVVIEASNRDGNKALCVFDIYIQYSRCETPSTPGNAGQIFCPQSTDEQLRNYHQCSVTCSSNYRVVVPSPKIVTCGPVGSWDPFNRYVPFVMSPCGIERTPKRRLTVVIVYRVPSTECSEVKQDLREQMALRLQDQNRKWSNGLCKQLDCSDIVVVINCNIVIPTSSGRRKRQSPYSDVTIDLTANDVPLLLTSSTTTGLTISPEDLLQLLILSDSVFDFSDRVAGAVPDPNGLDVQVHLLCQAPMALSGDKCVECAAGSYYDSTTSTCALCEIGSYQPQSNQNSCSQCPSGKTTETVGSISDTQCKDTCSAGQYYSNTLGSCANCAQGFHQNISGLFHCLPCPVDKTTREEGAASSTVCFNDCPAGQELTQNGNCTACNIGFYKPFGVTVCQKCPTGLVTNYTGAQSVADCNVADNQPGYYRSPLNESEALPCPRGTFQTEKWQYTCTSCGGERFRTDSEGSTSRSQCRYFCPAGQQRVGNEERCEPCSYGYFRTGDNPYSLCELCPNNTRTAETGSISASNCTIYKCSAGSKPTADQTGCDLCPRGSYQPLADQIDCLPCVGNKVDTRSNGSTQLSQCERFCDSGYEKLDNGTCVVCPLGFFKDNNIDNFHNCTACPDSNFVTSGPGATSATECNTLNCQPGYKSNGSSCVVCPQGTYQDQPYQSQCKPCPSQSSTRGNASTSINDCETYCDEGQEKNATSGLCDVCPRGYYKHNHNDAFMECTLCPSQYVTPTTASISQDNCTVLNCTEGEYINGGMCSKCDYGFYQPQRWQPSCLPCATHKTTRIQGAVNESDCFLSCPAGKENPTGTDICVECRQGFHKDVQSTAACSQCPTGYTTRINGSISVADCNLQACKPGSFADNTNGGNCTPCDYGQYQPDKWQEQCLPCASGFTTYQLEADSMDLCFLDCNPGEQYSTTSKTCEPCPVGYYNEDMDKARYTCAVCPPMFITASTGANSSQLCTIRNCTEAGQYRDSTNVCQDCPRGQWQNQKWQTSCVSCATGLTTKDVGSSSQSECKPDCASGQQLSQSDTCVPCPTGSYRVQGTSWQCVQCPAGLTTRGTGAASPQECSVANCTSGYFFNQQNQTCEVCQLNSYQDRPGQFTCKPCPDGSGTLQRGASAVSDCVDNCRQQNNCDANANCISTAAGINCICNDGYLGNGSTCTHMCDVQDYCKNFATCDRSQKRCVCTERYEGDRCELRTDPQKAGLSDKDIIIVATITSVALLFFLILLIICCCRTSGKQTARKNAYLSEGDERASIATRMSMRGFEDFSGGYSAKAPSIVTGPKMMLPVQAQQMYENPSYSFVDGRDPAIYQI